MDDVDIETLLHRILSGYLIFYYKNERYELRKISYSIRYKADLLYNKIVSDEKYSDWIRQDQVDNILINIGLWHKDTNKMMEKLEKSIENLKVELFENFLNTNNQKRIRSTLNRTRESLDKIKSIKTEFNANTLEGYASSIKHEFIICNSLYQNNKKVFDFENKDQNAVSLSKFNALVTEINKYNITILDFKKLARSYLWKSYWNIKSNQIFPGSVIEWTDDQRSLVSFSQMYDSIYEHPECPSENIISDDDMLDGWMIVQKRKVEKAKKQASIDNVNPSLKNANEVFLFGKNKDEAEEIIGLNSQESLGRLKEKLNFINNTGSANDSILPDNKRQILSDMNEMIKNRK